MPAQAVAQKSSAIAREVLNLAAYRRAQTIMTYVAFRNEVRTEIIIREALAQGKRVAVPLCSKARRQLIASQLLDFPGDLAPGTWGIPEPKPEALRPLDPQAIDLVIVPGVAFDRRGYRLGYGGGYYDRFLLRLGQGSVSVGVAFSLQVVDELPCEERDRPVNLVITESGIFGPRS
ncbi:MAG: 5-formyltetrahydrofolate cyclo-ligase [Clostridia bacterium]|nr:5-formyltetrahydrofolate cyclo-ligase [Clostridia bacterium]